MKRGFTLIDCVIYMSLFSIIISSGVVISAAMIHSMKKLHTHIVSMREIDFVFRKIGWMFDGNNMVYVPKQNTSSEYLKVSKSGRIYEIKLSNGILYLIYDNGESRPLSTDGVRITNARFASIGTGVNALEVVIDTATASFTRLYIELP